MARARKKYPQLRILPDPASESAKVGAIAATFDTDRKHLTAREVERLIQATRGARNEARDGCLLLLTFRNGLRVSDACRLRLDQVNREETNAA
jgi:integrase